MQKILEVRKPPHGESRWVKPIANSVLEFSAEIGIQASVKDITHNEFGDITHIYIVLDYVDLEQFNVLEEKIRALPQYEEKFGKYIDWSILQDWCW